MNFGSLPFVYKLALFHVLYCSYNMQDRPSPPPINKFVYTRKDNTRFVGGNSFVKDIANNVEDKVLNIYSSSSVN